MASTNPAVKVVEVCHISPSSQSPESAIEVSLPLSFFDIFFLKSYVSESNFFYNLTDLTPAMFHTEILPKLKSSLSLTLLHFLPIAGNVIWPPNAAKPIIHYSPKDKGGVSLTVAESNNIADFDCLSSYEMHDASMSHPYIPKLSISDTKVSILALQITLFQNKGFSIGYAFNHAALDGKALLMFLKAWAHICKHNTNLLPAELSPFFDRTVVQDPEGIDMEYVKNWSSMSQLLGLEDSNINNAISLKPIPVAEAPPGSVQATFSFSREDIQILRERILSQYEKERKPAINLSSFVISYAYALVCRTKAIGGLKRHDKIIFGFSGDCRGRLDPPIPANYFGNGLGFYYGSSEGEAIIGDKGIAFVAQTLSELVKQMVKGALDGAKDKLAELMALTNQGKHMLAISGSPEFEVYAIDFGWGSPKIMKFSNLDTSKFISMVKSKEGGGVEISLVLEKHEMEIFQTLFAEGLQVADIQKLSRL